MPRAIDDPVSAEEAIRELAAMPVSDLDLHEETRQALIKLLEIGAVTATRNPAGQLLFEVPSHPRDGQCRRSP